MAYYKHVGLLGKAGAGKDTVAARLSQRYGFQRIAFADPLKGMALSVDPIVDAWAHSDGMDAETVRLSEIVAELGWDDAKRRYHEVRRLLQRMGEAVRVHDPDFWVNVALNKVDQADTHNLPVVITDVRYRNEAEALRARGFYLIRVVRPGAGVVGAGAAHSSETDLDNFYADLTIANVGTLNELRSGVDQMHLPRR